MFFHAFTHALVRLAIAEFWASVKTPKLGHASVVHSIASSAAVKQVELQELTSVQRISVEDNCRGQHAVDRHRFKFVKALVSLLNDEKERERENLN